MKPINTLIRNNIASLLPYSCARDEYESSLGIFLDANENSFGSPAGKGLNRYPDPLQKELKTAIGNLKSINPKNIFLGNGSDEAIDLVYRIFCEPKKNKAIICPPTYGMYEVYAGINDIETIKIPLIAESFQLNIPEILNAITSDTKVIFICSPNNPTGNMMERKDIEEILNKFNGIVVVDEAYIDFASIESITPLVHSFPNLIVLQTLSKAWGMASLRVGLAIANEEIIHFFNNVKPPYNISGLTQKTAISALNNSQKAQKMVSQILKEKKNLSKALMLISGVEKIYPSDANFLLVKFKDANRTYKYLIDNLIIVRNRSNVLLCDNCIRITIGTPEENRELIDCLLNQNL